MPKDVPKDPWGTRLSFIGSPASTRPDEPEIMSLGADGQPGGEGINADIVSWKNQ